MNKLNILIIDDSKAREFEGIKTTYVKELKKKLNEYDGEIDITILGKTYYTSCDAIIDINKPKISEKDYDIVIINLGINDCSPRLLNITYRNLLMKLPKHLGFIIRKFILRKYRKTLFKIFGKRLLVTPEEYEDNLIKIIKLLTIKKVILMTISPINAKLENKLPGISINILEFNNRLKKIDKVELFDCHKLISKIGPEKALIDGVHYYEDTCEKIAYNLNQIILKNER